MPGSGGAASPRDTLPCRTGRAGGEHLAGSAEAQEAHVSRRVANLTLDNLSDLPVRCRSCVFWELDPVAGQAAARVR